MCVVLGDSDLDVDVVVSVAVAVQSLDSLPCQTDLLVGLATSWDLEHGHHGDD